MDASEARQDEQGATKPSSRETLVARNVAKVYRTGELELLALRGVDFALHEAELVVLLGPSGSGKSTLLNILGGLDTPTSGRVTFCDHDLTAAIESALFRDGPAWAVFVDAGGRAGLRHVELGRRNGVSAEIAAGLAAGERVVLHPSDRVADGVRVSGRGS